MSRKTTAVTGGQTGSIDQYNNLRDEAELSSRLLARAQASPNMTLYVSEGAIYFGTTRIDFAGGNSPSFVAPVSNPRIDCLSMNSSGVLVITQGTEGASPAEPTCPAGNLPICLVYNRVGETSIKQTSDGSNGYIYKDIRSAGGSKVFTSTSSGSSDAGKGVETDANGMIDGSLLNVSFGDGSDGDVTISSPTTLTRDMYYNNLTVNSTLTTDGYKIFVKNKIDGSGTIDWGTPNSGQAGVDGSATSQTTALGGAQSGNGKLKNVAGGDGAQSGSNSGTMGGSPSYSSSQPAESLYCLGQAGQQGGGGGTYSSYLGGTAGAGGIATAPYTIFGKYRILTMFMADLYSDMTLKLYTPQGKASGGGSGADRSTSYTCGSGGGGGASGGIVFISARVWAGTFTIKAIGGSGGRGGNAQTSTTGSGGGGAGGNGGISVVVYGIKSWTGSYNLVGGTGGIAGTGGSNNGVAGANGLTGSYFELKSFNLI